MPRPRRSFLAAVSALLLLPAAVAASASPTAETFGVLVMAHGGTEEWDRTVRDAVAPIAAAVPTAIAFGMADADSLQAATTELEQRGVTRIAVVRLFISGASFLERTEQILGLRPGAPGRHHAEGHGNGHGGGHGTDAPAASGHSMALYRLHTAARFALSREVPGCVTRLIRNGLVVHEAEGTTLSFTDSEQGSKRAPAYYRVEVEGPETGEEVDYDSELAAVSKLFTNPIFVRF